MVAKITINGIQSNLHVEILKYTVSINHFLNINVLLYKIKKMAIFKFK